MNIPQFYLVEPYNAYAPKQNKKHWHQIIEEQALLARIQAEHMALQEAANNTLPPNSPDVSTPTVGNAAGAGGVMPSIVFHPESANVTFSFLPATAAGPVTIAFTSSVDNSELYSYNWIFSDGQTSTLQNPRILFQSGSNSTNVITASLQVTSSLFGTPGRSTGNTFISASKPTVTAGFTLVTSSVSASATVTFTNTTVNTSQTPSTTYLWTFGSGSLTSSVATPNSVTYTVAGPYTASLQSTGSYGIASIITRSFRLA